MLLAAAVPGALAISQAPAAASPGDSPVILSITSMTPAWAKPGDIITVSGTVKNDSKTIFSHLSVQLDFAGTAVAGLSALEQDVVSSAPQLAFNQVAGRVSQPSTVLRPGQVSSWSVRFPADELKMTAFGVYPLAAQLENSLGDTLAYSNTFLPYVPASHGPYAKSVPAQQRIAWLWPMMDVPLAALPGRADCSGSQVSALGASLAAGGRLDQLLAAGAANSTTDKLTWAIDPALLEDASALAACGPAAHPHAAATWLSQLKKATARQQLFVTPYGNVSLALIRQRRSQDVSEAFSLGSQVASPLLNPNAGQTAAGTRGCSTATAWAPEDVSVPILQNLIETDGISTVVLPGGSVSGAPGTAFTAPGITQCPVKVLLSASPLTELLSTASGRPGLEFSTGQAFLAETALMAGEGSADPIVVAPPQHPGSWQPSASLAQTLLTYTHSAPWLTPVSLADLAATATKADPNLTMAAGGDSGSFSRAVLHELNVVGTDVTAVTSIAAKAAPTTEASMALAGLESANWPAHDQLARLAELTKLASWLSQQWGPAGLRIVADSRVTLGGLKGNMPVVIDNTLPYPVEVKLDPTFAQPPGGGVTVTQKPAGFVIVAAQHQVTTTLHVQATQVGSTTITLQLLNRANQPLPATERVVVQATQFGTFAMIILAVALGLFVIASGARAVRRGRAASPGNSEDAGQSEEIGGSQQPPEPDTVVPEPSELGAAGSSGPL